MAGNILGRRSYYLYTSDTGDEFSILTDDSLAEAVGLVLNADNPAPPRRFQPRVLHVEFNSDAGLKRKSLVIGDASQANYSSNTTSTVTIDGDNYQTTGRRGETLSFPRNADPVDPGDIDTPDTTVVTGSP